jgi:hypothetical protein
MKKLKTFESFTAQEGLSFNDLSKEAQAAAIDANRDINVDHDDWADPIIEGFVEDMAEAGVSDVEVEYSGFWSQGDGASFIGVVRGEEDKAKLLNGSIGLNVPKEVIENIYINIRKDHYSRSSHSASMAVDVEVDGDDEVEIYIGPDVNVTLDIAEQCETIEPKVLEWARGKADDLYDTLESHYTSLTSDDEVKETLIANDYKFDDDGKII